MTSFYADEQYSYPVVKYLRELVFSLESSDGKLIHIDRSDREN